MKCRMLIWMFGGDTERQDKTRGAVGVVNISGVVTTNEEFWAVDSFWAC